MERTALKTWIYFTSILDSYEDDSVDLISVNLIIQIISSDLKGLDNTSESRRNLAPRFKIWS